MTKNDKNQNHGVYPYFLIEVIYGGWTPVRDSILSTFANCKDIKFLTLLNLVDTYLSSASTLQFSSVAITTSTANLCFAVR